MTGAGSSDARFRAVIDGPIVPTLLKLSGPVILVILAQIFVSVLEAYWVSRLGTNAVAGVALVLPLFVLMGTMSNGGIGGGVSSAISRAMGAGRGDDANALLAHSIVIAVGFGVLFTLVALAAGPAIYHALGGRGAALGAALTFSNWAFGGSIVVWLVNLTSSALRGAGVVRLPAIVSVVGAAILVPLSPVLIFGLGPFPALGLAGAGVATLIYYAGALIVYALYLRRPGSPLRLLMPTFEMRWFSAIMGVGSLSAVGTLVASLTVVAVTGAVGTFGSAALAGFGIASRLDSLLVPLLFGLGTGVITMVGAAVGAGRRDRAARVTSVAMGLALVLTGAIGLLAALFPLVWMGIFSNDPGVLAAGSTYLRTVGPAYAALGLGLSLYFASQGWGRMRWPFVAGAARLLVTAGGAYWFVALNLSLASVFVAVTAGLVLFAVINLIGIRRVIADAGTQGARVSARPRITATTGQEEL